MTARRPHKGLRAVVCRLFRKRQPICLHAWVVVSYPAEDRRPTVAKITATCDFKHGTDVFECGVEYDVSEGLALYFVNVGWASSDDATSEPQPQDVTLEIQDVVVETSAPKVGVSRG
jgi:hypothetical protein